MKTIKDYISEIDGLMILQKQNESKIHELESRNEELEEQIEDAEERLLELEIEESTERKICGESVYVKADNIAHEHFFEVLEEVSKNISINQLTELVKQYKG